VPLLAAWLVVAFGAGESVKVALWSADAVRIAASALVGFAILLLTQVTVGYAARSWANLNNVVCPTRVGERDSTERLLKVMNGHGLIPKIRTRIIVCRRHPGVCCLAEWTRNPICLRSGFDQLAGPHGLEPGNAGRIPYPDRGQVETLPRSYGLPVEGRGMLFEMGDDGRPGRAIWIP
jgi:hypothetical protein